MPTNVSLLDAILKKEQPHPSGAGANGGKATHQMLTGGKFVIDLETSDIASRTLKITIEEAIPVIAAGQPKHNGSNLLGYFDICMLLLLCNAILLEYDVLCIVFCSSQM